MLNYKKFVTR